MRTRDGCFDAFLEQNTRAEELELTLERTEHRLEQENEALKAQLAALSEPYTEAEALAVHPHCSLAVFGIANVMLQNRIHIYARKGATDATE
jgi:hypothetical protein